LGAFFAGACGVVFTDGAAASAGPAKAASAAPANIALNNDFKLHQTP
jgi:hypothetical protein